MAFTGVADSRCPLTLDHGALSEIVKTLECPKPIMDRSGALLNQEEMQTAIGDGLTAGVNRLKEAKAKSKIVILLTDGDNNAGNISPVQAAEIAKDIGIKVYTILIGKGGRVPYPTGTDLFGRTTYEPVEIDVNPELLQQIAKVTAGAFYPATDKESLENGLHSVLDSLEKSKIYEAGGSTRYDEWYARFFLPAALFGLLGLALRSSRLSGAP